jgi:hypothetical protein
MRTGVLPSILLAAVTVALGQESAPKPVPMGTVVGRVIAPGPNGTGLESARVSIYIGEIAYASTETDSAGLYSLVAPYHSDRHFSLYAEHPGFDMDLAHGTQVFPDSVSIQPDIYLWPECYVDTAALREFTTTSSVTLGSRRDDSLEYDSTLFKVYLNYLHGTHPLVLRSGIHKPDTIAMRHLPRELVEDGSFLLTGVGRCRYMEIELADHLQSGMRFYDVDSIQLGSRWPKNTFRLCRNATPSTWDWRFGLCLRVFLAKHRPIYIERFY